MRRLPKKARLWALLPTWLFVACADGNSKKIETGPGQNARSPLIGGNQNPLPPPGLDAQGGAAPQKVNIGDGNILEVLMQGKVEAIGIKACEGQFGLQINVSPKQGDDQSVIRVPKSMEKFQCLLIGKISLSDLLSHRDPGEPVPPLNNFASDGSALTIKQMSWFRFSPDRPLLPAFLTTPLEDLKKLNITKSITVTDLHPQNAAQAVTGQIQMRTRAFHETYMHQPMARNFSNVVEVEFKNQNFRGINQIGTFLFDEMVWTISLKPLAFLGLNATISVGDAVRSMLGIAPALGGAGLGAALGGKLGGLGGILIGAGAGAILGMASNAMQIHIDLNLVQQKNLPPPGQENATETGEKIGGQTTNALRDDGE